MALSQIPSQTHPLIDREHRITVPWFQFLMRLAQIVQAGEAGGALAGAGYILDAADPSLPNGRVVTDSLTVHVDLTEPGIMRWHVGGYWTPITNGDPLSPELLYDAEGDCVVGFVPTPEAG